MEYENLKNVCYEYMTPDRLRERIATCPVAYLCLGTLEWHGPHLPLGTDGLQGRGLFSRAAEALGGVVIPPLYWGPDRHVQENGEDYYGMEVYLEHIHCPRPYPLTRLPGNAFWLPDEVFDAMLTSVIRQLTRTGFRVFVATGHGPSVAHYRALALPLERELGIRMLTVDSPDAEPHYIYDHAAESETSNMQYFYGDLVHMQKLPEQWQDTIVGIAGRDPRQYASAEHLARRLPDILSRLKENVQQALESLAATEMQPE